HAFHVAGEALATAGARRFLFLGSGAVLSPEGWVRGLALLDAAGPGSAPQILGLDGGAAADAFVWTTEAFRAVLPRLPLFLGGRHGDNGLSEAGVGV
ncbi:hypothetical protein ABTC76_19985, partial [Acinetobacter baumannii]